MTSSDLKDRFDKHIAGSPRTILTAEEKEELKRRSQNHDASKAIMLLKDEVRGINLSISILKESRDARLDCIKTLESSKRTVGRGGA
jgi:hypothetical protein